MAENSIRSPGSPTQQDATIRAVLERRKTQARFPGETCEPPDGTPVQCPWGKPGDTLWVQEAFALSHHDPETVELDTRSPEGWDRPVYRADNPTGSWTRDSVIDGKLVSEPLKTPSWRPAIHMPRWASRITLRLTDVRVQQVQEISEADMLAEGLESLGWDYAETEDPSASPGTRYMYWRGDDDLPAGWMTPVEPIDDVWQWLWDSTHAEQGFPFSANPWVWALTFELAR